MRVKCGALTAPWLYEGEIAVYQLSDVSIKNKCDKSMSDLLKKSKESKEILKIIFLPEQSPASTRPDLR